MIPGTWKAVGPGGGRYHPDDPEIWRIPPPIILEHWPLSELVPDDDEEDE